MTGGKGPRQKGDRREHETIEILEYLGHRVTRSAGSMGEWDLIASNLQEITFVQVSSNAWKGPADRDTLETFPVPAGSAVLKVMIRVDDPRVRTEDREGRPGRIRVKVYDAETGIWIEVEALGEVFGECRTEIGRLKRAGLWPILRIRSTESYPQVIHRLSTHKKGGK